MLASQADLSIESDARDVGFVSDAHFYRSFRALTDLTPGEYR
jgi:AraC-like DNA-binding protein